MLEKMFDESSSYDDRQSVSEELLAKGQYESDPDEILKGFKVFQKRYVYKNTALQIVLVVLAIISQVMAIIADKSGDIMFNVMLITACVVLGVWVLLRPVNTAKNLRKGIEHLKGTVYEAEIYSDRIKITTIYDAPLENGDTVDTEKLSDTDKRGSEAVEEARINTVTGEEEAEDEIPATIIHLDSPMVEVTEREDMYVAYVKKVNMFVIPKHAFTADEIKAVDEKLSAIMGVRFKSME